MSLALRMAMGLLYLIACSACTSVDEIEPAAGATSQTTSWRHWQPEPDEASGGPKAVILALHGFNDYSFAFQDFATFAASSGVAVHAYDQRGFGANVDRGRWPGTDRLTQDLREGVARLRQIYGDKPIYVLGESMGGAVTIVSATHDEPLDVEGLILVAPAVWGGSYLNPFYRMTLWLAATFAPGWSLSPRGLDIYPSDNIEMLRAYGADPMVIKVTRTDAIAGLVSLMDEAIAAAPRLEKPVLLLFGKKDEVVPVSALESFRDRMERADATVIDYPDGYHMLLRDLQRMVVFEDILAWIERGSDKG